MNWKKIAKRVGLVVLGLYAFGVLVRIPYVIDAERTKEAVTQIHATKLTINDVMGVNLPPEPDANRKDATVEGIDANENGIRDDVELAIFAEYPNSAKTRAVLLQYALALQMEFTQPIVNEGIVIAVAQERSRAAICIGDITSRENTKKFIEETTRYTDFVKQGQINTQPRNEAEAEFLRHIGSTGDLANQDCDINLQNLSN